MVICGFLVGMLNCLSPQLVLEFVHIFSQFLERTAKSLQSTSVFVVSGRAVPDVLNISVITSKQAFWSLDNGLFS